ncbi:hypothetical protein M2150_002507 [Lachnospiraceae bacterium PM6-15]|uniref:Uncharacterized protein n=1 Tax=Ohessyouella blattaphilus TaxID=2949333 RepID=A0ABT1EL81_9FIRM|nr:hypothetical protein [Ohessyouella blattaphilus]MCP1111458.1 hypothetical protein [Ohessyouella blattaphilus]MCR8564852.1 hypothetical protein [Ohessyouella blattaphilus]
METLRRQYRLEDEVIELLESRDKVAFPRESNYISHALRELVYIQQLKQEVSEFKGELIDLKSMIAGLKEEVGRMDISSSATESEGDFKTEPAEKRRQLTRDEIDELLLFGDLESET